MNRNSDSSSLRVNKKLLLWNEMIGKIAMMIILGENAKKNVKFRLIKYFEDQRQELNNKEAKENKKYVIDVESNDK